MQRGEPRGGLGAALGAALLLWSGQPSALHAASHDVIISNNWALVGIHVDTSGAGTLDGMFSGGVPDGSQLLRWDATGQDYLDADTYIDPVGWFDSTFSPSPSLGLGQAALLSSPGPFPFTLTVTGAEPSPVPVPLAIEPCQYHLLASQNLNDPATYADIIGHTDAPAEHTVLARLVAGELLTPGAPLSPPAYVAYTYVGGHWLEEDGVGPVVTNAPQIARGEGVWILGPPALTIVSPPRDVVVEEAAITNGPLCATFSVGVFGGPATNVQWFSNSIPIPGATNLSYTLCPVTMADDGTAFTVTIENACGGITSDAALLSVVPDLTPPTVVAAFAHPTLNRITLVYSEAVEASSATNTLAYLVGFPGQSEFASLVELDADQRTVVVHLPLALVRNEVFSVTLSDITDLASNVIVPGTIAWVTTTADFGDAPDAGAGPPGPYPTLLASDGALHIIPVGGATWYLGETPPDIEPDGLADAGAQGDDGSADDDEDGLRIPPALWGGETAHLVATASTVGHLNAWIDYNRDGDWEDPGEQILTNRLLAAGWNSLPVQVPLAVASGTSFARFRFGSETDLTPAGWAGDGEVEDYPVELVSFEPPVITQQPADMDIPVGGTALWTVSVSGTPPFAYQWRRNGIDLPGATGPTLAVRNAHPADEAAYSVVVSNPAGSDTSDDASLLVWLPPVITAHPSDLLAGVGDNLAFCVLATSALPLRYQWLLNGTRLQGATNACLDVTDAGVPDAGSYAVLVSNPTGSLLSDQASLLLTNLAQVAPAHSVTNPTPITDDAGFVTTTNVAAGRDPSEPYHAGRFGSNSVWFAWEPEADGIATFSTRGSDFDTLLAVYAEASGALAAAGALTGPEAPAAPTLVAADDDRGGFKTSEVSFNAVAGTHYLVAVDGLAGDQGRLILGWNLERTTDTLPVISAPPHSQTVLRGAMAGFSVAAAGSLLTYQWMLDGAPIPGETTDTLLLADVQDADLGRYSVRVTNDELRSVDSDHAILQIGTDPAVQTVDKLGDLISQAILAGGGGGTGRGSGSGASPGFGLTATFSVAAGTIRHHSFSTVSGGTERGEPAHCGMDGGATSWLEIVAQEEGVCVIDTEGSSLDTVLAVYPLFSEALYFHRFTNLLGCGIDLGNHQSRLWFDIDPSLARRVVIDRLGTNDGVVNFTQVFVPGRDVVDLTLAPPDLAVPPGTNLVFRLTPDPPVPLQWRKEGVDIPGATNTTFALVDVDAADSAAYTVIAAQEFPERVLGRLDLAVAQPDALPPLSQVPLWKTWGEALILVFDPAQAPPDAVFQWLRNGEVLPGATNATLTLPNLQPGDFGDYILTANGEPVAVATLTVLDTHQHLIKPRHQELRLGLALGDALPPLSTFVWRRDGVLLPGATTPELVLADLDVADAATYQLTVRDAMSRVLIEGVFLVAVYDALPDGRWEVATSLDVLLWHTPDLDEPWYLYREIPAGQGVRFPVLPRGYYSLSQ